MKTCSKCREAKALTEFHRDKHKPDGLRTQCKECRVPSTAAYYVQHGERMRAANREWVAANRDKKAEYDRRGYLKYRDQRRSKIRQYQLANPEKTADHLRRRRAKMRGNGVYKISPKDMRRLAQMTCAHAHLSPCHGPMEQDHIIPIDRKGIHGIGNLQVLCKHHNASKSNKLEVEVRYEWSRRLSTAC